MTLSPVGGFVMGNRDLSPLSVLAEEVVLPTSPTKASPVDADGLGTGRSVIENERHALERVAWGA